MIHEHEHDIKLIALYNGNGFHRYATAEPMTVHVNDDVSFIIPKGFQTDGRSSGLFGFIVPRWGRGGRAAILHDYLYSINFQRAKADELYFKALKQYNPKRKGFNIFKNNQPVIENALSYLYVRAFGWILYLFK